MEPQRTLNNQLDWRSPTLAGQLHFGVISWGSESVWFRVLFSPGWLPAHHVHKMTLKILIFLPVSQVLRLQVCITPSLGTPVKSSGY